MATLQALPDSEAFRTIDGIAVVDICGPLTHHDEGFFDSYDAVRDRVAEALMSPAPAVILNIDSPGGDVSGCFEAVRELRRMSKASGKPLVAYTDGHAVSAGYALALAAVAVYLSSTAQVGSVGALSALFDQVELDQSLGMNYAVVTSGARKADGHPHAPITDESRAAVQAQVDHVADLFCELVAEVLGLTPEAVRGYEAAIFAGQNAVDAGLADQVAVFSEVLAALSGRYAGGRALGA